MRRFAGHAAEHVRSQACFWLAQMGDERAQGDITAALKSESSDDVREEIGFALSQLKDTADEALIAVVRGDFTRAVKKQALFRLWQSGSPEAMAYFDEALKQQARGSQILEQPIVGAGAHLEARRQPRLLQVRYRFAAGSNVDVFGIVTRRLPRFRCRASAAQQDMNRDD